MSSRPAVDVRDLWVSYRVRSQRRLGAEHGQRWALQGVELAVAPGEIVGVIGHNGSGKTTLLQTLAGVITPTRGSVTTTGRVASLVDLAAGFHRDLTGHENLRVGGVLLGLRRKEIRRRYDEIVAFTGLDDDALSSPIRTYSSGMALRLGFSLVIHSDPSVLLVDEVLAVGDEPFQQACLDRVERLRRNGCAVVLVSHDLPLVKERTERTLVLHRSRVRFSGDPSEAIDLYHRLEDDAP